MSKATKPSQKTPFRRPYTFPYISTAEMLQHQDPLTTPIPPHTTTSPPRPASAILSRLGLFHFQREQQLSQRRDAMSAPSSSTLYSSQPPTRVPTPPRVPAFNPGYAVGIHTGQLDGYRLDPICGICGVRRPCGCGRDGHGDRELGGFLDRQWWRYYDPSFFMRSIMVAVGVVIGFLDVWEVADVFWRRWDVGR